MMTIFNYNIFVTSVTNDTRSMNVADDDDVAPFVLLDELTCVDVASFFPPVTDRVF